MFLKILLLLFKSFALKDQLLIVIKIFRVRKKAFENETVFNLCYDMARKWP